MPRQPERCMCGAFDCKVCGKLQGTLTEGLRCEDCDLWGDNGCSIGESLTCKSAESCEHYEEGDACGSEPDYDFERKRRIEDRLIERMERDA